MIHIAQLSDFKDLEVPVGIPQTTYMRASIHKDYDRGPRRGSIRTVSEATGSRMVAPMWYGYMPWFAGDPRQLRRPAWDSVEVEKVLGRSFRHAWRSQRCLIPADAFFMWLNAKSRYAQRYCIRRADSGLMWIAGIWDYSYGPGEVKEKPIQERMGAAVLTRPSYGQVAKLFARMPLLLKPSALEPWVSLQVVEQHQIYLLTDPDDSPLMIYPVANDAVEAALFQEIEPPPGKPEPISPVLHIPG